MKNGTQAGLQLSVTAPATIASGVGVLIGVMFGVTVHAAASGDPLEIALTGVYKLAKATGQAWAVGAALYWDDTAKNLTTTVGSNKRVGYCAAAAASGDTTGAIRLTPGSSV